MLAASAPNSRLLGIDADPAALAAAEARLLPYSARASLVHGNFRELARLAAAHGFASADGILLDLGVSSVPARIAARGFSFAADAPLDMRLDPTQGPTAAELLNDTPEEALADLIYRYGDERGSRRIARQIGEARRKRPIASTGELAELVARALGGRHGKIHRRPARFKHCASPSTTSSRAWRRRCHRQSSCWRRAGAWRLSRSTHWRIGSSNCSSALEFGLCWQPAQPAGDRDQEADRGRRRRSAAQPAQPDAKLRIAERLGP